MLLVEYLVEKEKKITKYQDAYKETLDHLYNPKAFLSTPNRILLEHQQAFNLDILKSDVVLWNKNDLLPVSLGGNLQSS